MYPILYVIIQLQHIMFYLCILCCMWSYNYSILCYIYVSYIVCDHTATTYYVLSMYPMLYVIIQLQHIMFYLCILYCMWSYSYDILCSIYVSYVVCDHTATTYYVLSMYPMFYMIILPWYHDTKLITVIIIVNIICSFSLRCKQGGSKKVLNLYTVLYSFCIACTNTMLNEESVCCL